MDIKIIAQNEDRIKIVEKEIRIARNNFVWNFYPII